MPPLCPLCFLIFMSALIHISFSLSLTSGTAPTRGSPGLHNQTSPIGRPGFHNDSTTGAPGLHTTRSGGGLPGVATRGVTSQPGLQKPTTPNTGINKYSDCFSDSYGFFGCNLLLLQHNAIMLIFSSIRGHYRSTWTSPHHISPHWKAWAANYKRWEKKH